MRPKTLDKDFLKKKLNQSYILMSDALYVMLTY